LESIKEESNPLALLPNDELLNDSEKYFGESKTLQKPGHRVMVMKFVRDQYPLAKFERIYSASVDGWSRKDFHRSCDNKGWTLSII
jgi:hypothetical protein